MIPHDALVLNDALTGLEEHLPDSKQGRTKAYLPTDPETLLRSLGAEYTGDTLDTPIREFVGHLYVITPYDARRVLRYIQNDILREYLEGRD